ncbi:adenosylcobinamide amidohydrolase [Caldivirga sp. UBA161]|uniref:adenosylcobinamide amidohydrolase n=1 Tax=Caldivirga sp. UBA161 TaxID=1915569 RepID=UPI0025BC8031|nr:adenosylcobinamide amidohydrolase [Caldivirga sp. UBA161]
MIRQVKAANGDLVVTLSSTAVSLSSTVDGGLRHGVRYIIHHHVPGNFNTDPILEVRRIHEALSINSNEAITFLTATELPRNHVIVEEDTYGLKVAVSLTIGLSNPYRIEDGNVISLMRNPSTVNIAVIINANLTQPALVDAVALIAETKHEALSRLTNGKIHGTTSDAIAVLSLSSGELKPYAGPATDVGKAISHAVYNALIRAYEINQLKDH